MINSNINFDRSFSLYLHIPFCSRKCNYCDFYSRSASGKQIAGYTAALKKEIKMYATALREDRINTIYFGGGTPTLLSPAAIGEIMEVIDDCFLISPEGEITLEANPASLCRDTVAGYRRAGINRFSLGIQSFSDRELAFLGRLHSSREAIGAGQMLQKQSDNYNLDLIFALPGQGIVRWQNNLRQAVALKPQHISLYNLQIEEDTELGRRVKKGEILPAAEEIDARMYRQARNFLPANGYHQYEISNFSLPGYRSEHNRVYWLFKPYLGVGASAHSFTGSLRFYNVQDMDIYREIIAGDELPVAEINKLEERDLMAEKMILGLRLLAGVSKKEFYERFSREIDRIYGEEIRKLVSRGLLCNEGGRVYLTERGIMLGNRVFREFLP